MSLVKWWEIWKGKQSLVLQYNEIVDEEEWGNGDGGGDEEEEEEEEKEVGDKWLRKWEQRRRRGGEK